MGWLTKWLALRSVAAYGLFVLALTCAIPVHASRDAQTPDVSGDASRMVFKENSKNKKEPSCQLTLMHVYTSKFNKKFTQFAFTGSVVAKREAGKPMVLSVIGQNHQLATGGKDIKPFPIPRIELGVEDVSIRRFMGHKASCKSNSVCAQYTDNKKRELQSLLGDDSKNMHLLFPLVTKQAAVVIDLSKFAASSKNNQAPLAQFKSCTDHLR